MIPQCKGKALKDVPTSKIIYDNWIAMPKYDGNYVQIEKIGDAVRFFTSGKLEFYINYIARDICRIFKDNDVTIELEYTGKSNGMLGDRIYAAKLTSYRTAFKNGETLRSTPGHDKFRVFDILKFNGSTLIDSFDNRVKLLKSFTYTSNVALTEFHGPMSLTQAITYSNELIASGHEGAYAKHTTHLNLPGKRVNSAIKLKGDRNTADLLCIAVEAGEPNGKFINMIGSLVLKDSKGRICKVGSGLSVNDRKLPFSYFIGKIIEISYEQILDTYIQPVYECIRLDKVESD